MFRHKGSRKIDVLLTELFPLVTVLFVWAHSYIFVQCFYIHLIVCEEGRSTLHLIFLQWICTRYVNDRVLLSLIFSNEDQIVSWVSFCVSLQEGHQTTSPTVSPVPKTTPRAVRCAHLPSPGNVSDITPRMKTIFPKSASSGTRCDWLRIVLFIHSWDREWDQQYWV